MFCSSVSLYDEAFNPLKCNFWQVVELAKQAIKNASVCARCIKKIRWKLSFIDSRLHKKLLVLVFPSFPPSLSVTSFGFFLDNHNFLKAMPVESNSEQKQTSTYLKVQNRCYASKAILLFMTKEKCEINQMKKSFLSLLKKMLMKINFKGWKIVLSPLIAFDYVFVEID